MLQSPNNDIELLVIGRVVEPPTIHFSLKKVRGHLAYARTAPIPMPLALHSS